MIWLEAQVPIEQVHTFLMPGAAQCADLVRRARVALRDVEKRCACIRKDILAESKEREKARK